MKKIPCPSWSLGVAILCGSIISPQADTNEVTGESRETETITNPLLEKFQPVASVFVDKVGEGIDPFFPNSKRRVPKEPDPINDSSPAVDVAEMAIAGIKLKGILGTERRRTALINNRTFGVGESAELRLPEGAVKIRCDSISATEAVITLLDTGVTKKLTIDQ